MLRHPEFSWHVRWLYKLRKWKDERAELREPFSSSRRYMRSHYQLLRLEEAAKSNPSVACCGKRISAPLETWGSLSMRCRIMARRNKKRPGG